MPEPSQIVRHCRADRGFREVINGGLNGGFKVKDFEFLIELPHRHLICIECCRVWIELGAYSANSSLSKCLESKRLREQLGGLRLGRPPTMTDLRQSLIESAVRAVEGCEYCVRIVMLLEGLAGVQKSVLPEDSTPAFLDSFPTSRKLRKWKPTNTVGIDDRYL